MIAERAAFTYALLCTPATLYPRSIFRSHFPLTDADYDSDTLLRLRKALAPYQEREQSASGQEKAFLQLLIQGVEGALSFLEANDLSGFDLMATIQTYYSVAEEYYCGRLGLDWSYSPPVVADRYPEPAQDADWFAVSGVPGGPRPGHPEGIYFLRRHMMPSVAELATLHENVHHVGMGGRGKGGYYRYFDEGCANFLAYLVYFHKNHNLEAIRLYRVFLQEINTSLYEYPSFDRIMASLIHQVGVAGLYRLIVRRLSDPESVDWKEVLRATAAGRMRVDLQPGDSPDTELPPIIHEMQAGADKMIARITYPERVLMSPVAYQAYDRMCRQGTLTVDSLQVEWQLSSQEALAVVKEVEDMDLWTRANGWIRPAGRSDLFHGTGVVRATTGKPVR